jgi:hypothetical protein
MRGLRGAAFLVVVCLVTLPGCGRSREEKAAEGEKTAEGAKPGGEVWKPTGNEGNIVGKVDFKGTPPKLKPIQMDADAVCASKHSGPVQPEVVVANKNGTLRNVFVYVKSGLEGKTFAPPDQAVTLDQQGCQYKPHVIGIQTNQSLRVVTSDNTTHNIHPLPKVNREWNVSQPPNADPIVRSFSRPEATIPVKCNQHPWMRAYIHVLDHPFYAVTGEDGTFKLTLPPGNYEIEALHEQYGATSQKVSVAANETKTVDFQYAAGQAYRPGSLKTMPALVLHCCTED